MDSQDITADIVAQAIVDVEGGTWKALAVFDAADGEYRLYIAAKDVPVLAGTYKHAKAMAKVVHHTMSQKFPRQRPRVDTFDDLVRSSVGSVVPKCFGQRLVSLDIDPVRCGSCPFQTTCGRTETQIGEAGEVVVQEPSAVLQERIRIKLLSRYGETHDA